MADLFGLGEIIGSAIQGLFNIYSTGSTNSSNRKIARETNEFNAQQAALNRQFQSQEAQIARDWQEEQYNLYTSPQAMVRQYGEAGLNPALMYGQNLQSSTGGSSAPSGSAASGVAIPAVAPDLSGLVGAFMGLSKLKAEIDNIGADTENKKAQAALAGSSAALNDSIKSLNKSQMAKIESEINLMKKQADSEKARKELIVVEAALKQSERSQVDFKNAVSEQFKRITGVEADSQTISMLLLTASNLVSGVVGSGFGLIGKLFGGKKSLKLPKTN